MKNAANMKIITTFPVNIIPSSLSLMSFSRPRSTASKGVKSPYLTDDLASTTTFWRLIRLVEDCSELGYSLPSADSTSSRLRLA